MQKSWIIFFVLTIVGFVSYSQDNPIRNQVASLDRVVLPSPEVTAMQRYGNWPMGNYTGTASINIPLFELSSGRLKLPVSLAYSSSGTRTNDVGSNMGLGWVLNASGSVNRTMMGGQVDEITNSTWGYWSSFPFPPSSYFGNNYQFEWQRMELYSQGKFDAQPDVFTYSGAGINGKFVFDTGKVAHLLPYNMHAVEKQIGTSLSNPLTGLTVGSPSIGFTIIDENGTIYQFLDYEFSNTEPKSYKNDDVSPIVPVDVNYSDSYISTWHLTNIISADKKDTIHFTYELAEISYRIHGGSTISSAMKIQGDHAPFLDPFTRTRTIVYNTVKSKRLKKVEFNNGYLQFYEGAPRKYMQGGANLDSIVLYQKGGQRVKSFTFDYWYLQGTSLLTPENVSGSTSMDDLRLLLRSITEKGSDVSALPSHKFNYEHSLPLPSKIIGGGDTWGYANGKIYNGIGDSITSYVHSYALDNFDQSYGALMKLKKPNFNYAKQGMLTKIDYPGGGSTLFNYEPHYKQSSSTYSVEVCDGNREVEFTGVQFAPSIPNDPDAPPFPKFKITSSTTTTVTVSLDSRHANFPLYYYVEIRDSATNALKFTYYKSSVYCDTYTSNPYPICSKQVTFSAGTYYIIAKNTGQTYSGAASDIYCKVSVPPVNCHTESIQVIDTVSVGGVRVQSAIDIDSVTGKKIARIYEYENELTPSLFTGNYLTQSNYDWISTNLGGGGLGNTSYSIESEKVLSSNSLYPLTDVSGFYVGYGKVRQKEVDLLTGKSNGYTEYYYSNEIDDGLHETDYQFPAYPPYVAQSWKRGKLVRTMHYKMQDVTPVLLRDEKRNYSVLKEKSRVSGEAFFTKVHVLPTSDWPIFLGSEYDAPRYVLHTPYYYVSSYNVMDTLTVTEYAATGDVVTTKTVYEYDTTTLLPKKITLWNSSNSEKIITELKRPFDYSNITSTGTLSAGIKELRNNHIWSPEVEKSIYRSAMDGTNKRLIGSQFNSYRQDAPLRDKISVLENIPPITDFTPSSVQAGAVSMDSRYAERIYFNQYDASGNVIEQQKANDVKNSYIWGYDGAYPIAEVVNGNVSDIFHTSFEDTEGNSTTGDSKTGKKSKTTGYIKSLTGLSGGSYILSYWKKSGGTWTYQESTVSVGGTTYNISLSGQVDEVRFYPEKAKMTSYTYEPLIGMTSQCDVNNRITYYEYDAFGRLAQVWDQDKNIIKKICYNYAGQPEGCMYDLTPDWVNTGLTRCQPCPSNSNYITNIREHQEKDANPHSPTYNTYRWVSDGINSNCVVSADWQNTTTAIRCKKNGSNQNTGEQEREQKDMNPCSSTYNQTRWIVTGTNTIACPLPSVNVTIKSTNPTPITGFTAKYTNKVTSVVYTFNIPSGGGLQTLGTIPSGTYDLVISKTSNNTNLMFGSGCGSQSVSGKSASFFNISVYTTDCFSIYIDNIL